MNSNYLFTKLENHNELLHEINSLESKMAQALGEEVRLIAYSHVSSDDRSKGEMNNGEPVKPS
ncbi:MAG: hypothetical protein H7X86_11830 [Gorillibacterium sp.]|nr:hypothetical protein [Gorillibacterium sp.]